MNRRTWMCGGVLALAGMATSAAAQYPPSAIPGSPGSMAGLQGPATAPPALGSATPSTEQVPSAPPTTPQQSQAQTQASNPPEEPGAGAPNAGGSGGSYQVALTAPATGLEAAAATGGAAGNTVSFSSSSLLLPGLFTAAQAESARPVDRVFMNYGYFDGFRSVVTSLNPASPTGQYLQSRTVSGFNLNLFEFGVEKTFLDGRASAILTVPYLDAENNITGQPIDGFGDIDAGIKFEIFADSATGSVLSAGMDVSAPTGRRSVFTVTQAVDISPAGNTILSRATTTTNPTYLQPYVVGLLGLDRLFVQDFLGVLIATDSRIAPFINNDLGVGYQLYRSESGFFSSLTPIIDVQALFPTAHEGTPAAPAPVAFGMTPPPVSTPTAFNFPNQVFLTEGVQIGLGQRSVLSLGVVEPVVGPKAFTIGATAGFNLFF